MKVLLVVVGLALLTGACVPESEVKQRENAAYWQGKNSGEREGREKAEQVCKTEKTEMQAAHKVELEESVADAERKSKIESTIVFTGGVISGVIFCLIAGVMLLLLGVIVVLFVMFLKKDDVAFNEFMDLLKG